MAKHYEMPGILLVFDKTFSEGNMIIFHKCGAGISVNLLASLSKYPYNTMYQSGCGSRNRVLLLNSDECVKDIKAEY